MTTARASLVPADTSGFFHCVSRCVRRAFLCGADRLTDRSFEHRKSWIEDRLHVLAGLFAIGVFGYAVMSNHVHVVMHVDVERARRWSERTIARRWCRLFPRRDDDSQAFEARVRRLSEDAPRVAQCRQRLADLSWFMRCLNEPIARRANAEDDCTGRFWEGRFRCQVLLDERAILAAMAYVDLNPIRAGMATRLEDSNHTSVQRRFRAAMRSIAVSGRVLRPACGRSSLRWRYSVADYIELVDWTGRQLRSGKRGAISEHAPKALDRLGVAADAWTTQVRGVGSGYWRAMGAVQTLIAKAAAMGQRWLKGVGFAQRLARI